MKTTFILALLSITLSFSASAQDVTPKMQSFIDMLDGTEKAATSAIKKYASKDVIKDKIIPLGSKATVSKDEDGCYLLSLDDNGEIHKYQVCWTNEKISTFKWLFNN